jgi:hypothetical protein
MSLADIGVALSPIVRSSVAGALASPAMMGDSSMFWCSSRVSTAAICFAGDALMSSAGARRDVASRPKSNGVDFAGGLNR